MPRLRDLKLLRGGPILSQQTHKTIVPRFEFEWGQIFRTETKLTLV